ncbi:MAG: glycosyltransferase, partial [Acidimicrobiia bacterium]|nr:glycosyltransferase [Acidimicrobiia bacterium]
IISATRHEATNVGVLVERLSTVLEDDLRWELLFVDDSDDETPAVIRGLVDDGHPVRMLHRPVGSRPGGLSGALTLALNNTTSPICVVIDADLQHPPELLPTLVDLVRDGEADVAIASRYVTGGSSAGLDGPVRQAVSRAAVLVVKLFFADLRAVRDPVSGFFALRREVVDATTLRPEGFKMLVEVLVRADWDEFAEVPYHFVGRTMGASKTSLKLGLYFLRHVLRLWLETTAPRWMSRMGKQNPAHAPGPVLTEADFTFADQRSS